jgi:hypothetical protein
MHRTVLAFLLCSTDLMMVHLSWASIMRDAILGIAMLLLTLAAVLCHAMSFRV